jgi:Peptidase A4 family
MLRPSRFTLSLAVVASLALAPAAAAATTQSSNWAGYAVHRSGVSFKRVLGTWRQPSATCVAGVPTYSSAWVGLGGYNETSNALEQIGSEVDCSARGTVESSAWYELVPAPSRTIKMTVRPGDQLSAEVSVDGHEVTLSLHDLTRAHTFKRIVHVSTLDTSSADWIVEAPSQCAGSSFCQTLPLADFGTATFGNAEAVTTSGHAGGISDRAWDRTEITLAAGARRFIGQGATAGTASAVPSTLVARGTAFTITYRGSTTTTTAAPAQSRLRATPLVRPALAYR